MPPCDKIPENPEKLQEFPKTTKNASILEKSVTFFKVAHVTAKIVKKPYFYSNNTYNIIIIYINKDLSHCHNRGVKKKTI